MNNLSLNRPARLIDVLLIIVIAIILGFMLMPVYTHDGGASRVVCLSNLKQITTADMMYAADNGERFPPYYTFDSVESTRTFFPLLRPYIKTYSSETLLCREDEQHLNDRSSDGSHEGIPGEVSYVHCLSLKGHIPDFSKGKRVLNWQEVESPQLASMLRDPIRGFGKGKDRNGQEISTVFLGPHASRFNVSYVDGHAHAQQPIDQLKEL